MNDSFLLLVECLNDFFPLLLAGCMNNFSPSSCGVYEIKNDWQIVVLCEPVLTGTEGDQGPRFPAIHRVHRCTQRWSHEGHVRTVQAARGSQQPTRQQGQSNSQRILFVLINTTASAFQLFSLSRPWFKPIISPLFLQYLSHLGTAPAFIPMCWIIFFIRENEKGVISESFYYIVFLMRELELKNFIC